MMKNDRQSMILEIISQENIETQEQLLSRLQERGINSTQATISRDIKQMHLIKEPAGLGVYKYAVSGNRTKLNFAEKLRSLPMIDKEVRQFTRFFLAGAASVEVDKQGRILLPAVLREFADITKDAVLIGVGNRIEIWSRDRWEGTVTYQDMEEITRHMAELGIGI